MSDAQPLVVGNWKMHGTRTGAEQLAQALLSGIAQQPCGAELAVCPPAVHVDAVAQALGAGEIGIGGQDCAVASAGAYTGDVSAEMLADLGCRYCIVGHSERRAAHRESDAMVADKAAAVRRAGLAPIVCVGETTAQREAGEADAVIERQLNAVLDVLKDADLVVAYEPVWAIGSGVSATPEQAQAVHARIRSLLAQRDAERAPSVRILYGGSVKGANAAALFAMQDIDGGLIGGASLDARDFLAIGEAAAASRVKG